ncbi:MAG: hypothetical protein JW997_03810 [Actinobacteria bacterium]|nr:hypothetical protein [Actinomycetota bacterium]
MNKDKHINKKVLKKFIDLMDKDMDIDTCLFKFPDNQEILKQYGKIVEGVKNLKNIRTADDLEEKSLKDIYLRAKIENIEGRKKDFKKDMFFIRLRPAFLKPLLIFLGVFIFISFSFTGTIYASSDSVPGELLYSVKRASENIQVTLTPYRYENTIYLKMLDSRLSEADALLELGDFADTAALEKLVTDIDDTYESCRKRNYLDSDQDFNMQNRIRTVKEGFKRRYGMQGKNTDDFSGNTAEDIQDTDNAGTGDQDCKQDNTASTDNGKAENTNSSDNGEQNQKGKQNQYGK